MDCSLPGSSIHGTLQARILEWVFPSPGDLLDPGIEHQSLTLQAKSLPSESPGKPRYFIYIISFHLYNEMGNPMRWENWTQRPGER